MVDTNINKSKLYDLAKCIATILVVIAHTTRMYTPDGAIKVVNQSDFLANVTKYIYAFHMPLFFMLSGCVYGYCIEHGKYKDDMAFAVNKGKKLLIPYFFWGIFYVAPIVCALGITQGGFIKYVISGIFLSWNSRHLWYVLALFLIFLLVMPLRRLLLKEKWLVVGIISLMLLVVSSKLPIVFQIQAACRYQVFFFMGIILNRFYHQFNCFCTKCGLIAFIFPFALLLMFLCDANIILEYAYVLIGCSMIMILSWGLLKWFPSAFESPAYQAFKRNTFGIYLFHPMIIYVMFYICGGYDLNPVLLSALASICAIALSILATNVVRKLHLQLLIGERI